MRLRRAIVTALLLATAGAAAAQARDDTLYRAWGGEAGIRAVMEDFVPRLAADPRIAAHFARSNLPHLTTQLTAQLCELAGGPCRYEGAPMDLAHQDLGISHADFNALVELLQTSMRARGVPRAAQNAMLAKLAPMHRDIVSPRQP
jgi:hemoglobin